jgi:hypothetical protein
MSHVYAVKVLLGNGRWRRLYSVPLGQTDADREAHELRATGHDVEVMPAGEARERRRKERRGGRR